jgi:hypothetical protein
MSLFTNCHIQKSLQWNLNDHSSSAEERLELPLVLWLLVERSPVLLRLNRHPIPHLHIALLLQILPLLLIEQAQALQERAVHRFQNNIVAGAQEVDESEALHVHLILRRRNNPVHAAVQVAVGPEVHHIRRVNDDAAGNVLDSFPAAITRLQLEPRNGLREQERHAAEIRVAAGVDAFVLLVHLRAARVVLHVAQEAGALVLVPVSVHHVVLGELEHQGDQAQHAVRHVLVHVAVELLDLVVVIQDGLRVRPLILGVEFKDVVALPIITASGELLDGAKGSVAVVVTVFELRTEFLLLGHGELEDLFAKSPLVVDLSLGETEVGDVKEAWDEALLVYL